MSATSPLTKLLWKLVAAAALLFSATAQAEVTLRDEPLPGIKREMGYFPAADGTSLAYVAYRPSAGRRYPTIAWFDVYGAGSLPPVAFVRSWVERGYAFVGASVRGTACSQGSYIPFSEQEGKDGAAFVDWAGSQVWSSGKVGLAGNSQPGITQFSIASHKPKHLVAIAPGGTLSRIYDDGWYIGGIYNASFAAHWSRIDQPYASRFGASLRLKLGDETCKATEAKITPNPLIRLNREQPYDSDYYRQFSPYERAPEVTVPTLMVHSWTDPAVGASALWVFDRVAAKHKRLFVLNGGHDAYLYTNAWAEVQRWMDRWVKGERNGVEREPRVRIDFENALPGAVGFGDLIQASPGWTATLTDWPAKETQWRRLRLSADGQLDDEASITTAAGKDGDRRYFYPAGSEQMGDNAQFAAVAADFGSLRYRGAPVAADTAIVGTPQLTLYASSELENTDFMAVLHDVSANGDVTYLQRGYLRASRRAVDAARSTPQRVFHPHQQDEPLQPAQVYEFRISMWPLAHVLRAGHSLELLIAAPSPTPSPWGLLPVMQSGFNTVLQNESYRSSLLLPVVPGIRAQAPEPACGSRPFQPCRAAPVIKSQ